MKTLTLVEKPAPWGTVVDLPKHVMRYFPDEGGFDDMIFWTPNATSYCLIASEDAPWLLGDKVVALASINGGGEIRWYVGRCFGQEDRLAVEAFGLVERDCD